MIQLVAAGFFNKPANIERATMTAADYFEYCRIAYLAARRKGEVVDASLSERDMYARYADGRHEGLLDMGCMATDMPAERHLAQNRRRRA